MKAALFALALPVAVIAAPACATEATYTLGLFAEDTYFEKTRLTLDDAYARAGTDMSEAACVHASRLLNAWGSFTACVKVDPVPVHSLPPEPVAPSGFILVDAQEPAHVMSRYAPDSALTCYQDSIRWDMRAECRLAHAPGRSLTDCELAGIAPTDGNLAACFGETR